MSISIKSKLFILRISFANQNQKTTIIIPPSFSVSNFCSSSLPRYFIKEIEKGKNISKLRKMIIIIKISSNTIARHRGRTVKRLEAKTYQTIETYITIYVHNRFAPNTNSIPVELRVRDFCYYSSECTFRDVKVLVVVFTSPIDPSTLYLDAKLLVPRIWNNDGPR